MRANWLIAVLVLGFSLPALAKANIVFGFKGGAAELEIAKQIVEGFNRSHSNIEVEVLDLTAGGDWPTKLSVLFAAGTPPDVVRMEYQRSFGYVADGLLQPLDPFIAKDKSFRIRDFFPVSIAAHSVAGKVYALPQEAQPFTMFVNRTELDKAGFTVPGMDWTMDQLLDMARKTTRDANGDGRPEIFGWQFDVSTTRLEPYFMAFGARWLNDEKTRFMLDSPQAQRALQFLADAVNVYQVKGGKFDQGTAVFYGMGGPWMVPGYRQSIKGWDWDILPAPGGPGGRGTTLGSDGYYIAKGTRNPEAAWEFIKYITSAESLTRMTEQGNLFPARSAVAIAYANKKPSQPPFSLGAYMKGIEITRPTQTYRQFVVAERTFTETMNKVFANQIGPSEAAGQLLPPLNALLKE